MAADAIMPRERREECGGGGGDGGVTAAPADDISFLPIAAPLLREALTAVVVAAGNFI